MNANNEDNIETQEPIIDIHTRYAELYLTPFGTLADIAAALYPGYSPTPEVEREEVILRVLLKEFAPEQVEIFQTARLARQPSPQEITDERPTTNTPT